MNDFSGVNRREWPLTDEYKLANPSWDKEPDQEPEPEQSPPRGTLHGELRVFSVADINTADQRGYLLKGLISPAEISVWVGAPKCGKSFLLLYISYMLSLGLTIFGRRVKKTKVLYVAAEGEGGIAKRIEALRRRYGNSPNFHFIAQPADLLHSSGHLDDLILAAKAVGAQLIVLDTLSRLMAGGDENSPQDMGTFVMNVTELRHSTGSHVAIIHHGTKASNGTNPRGHSSLTGADDALIEVAKLEDGSRTATVIHAKDDPDGMRWGFALDRVDLGEDDDGDAITTLIVNERIEAPAINPAAPKPSSNEKIALQSLQKAINASPILAIVTDDNVQRAVTTEAIWRERFYTEGKPGDTAHTKLVAFNRAKIGLLAKELIAAERDYVWPSHP